MSTTSDMQGLVCGEPELTHVCIIYKYKELFKEVGMVVPKKHANKGREYSSTKVNPTFFLPNADKDSSIYHLFYK